MTTTKLTAAELLTLIEQGRRSFRGATILTDFVWDDIESSTTLIDENIDLSDTTFLGTVDIGDLHILGELNFARATFAGRCALYRMQIKQINAEGALFHRGLGLVNATIKAALFARACFAKDTTCHPNGLVIKQTTGALLDLTDAWSPATILECDFDTVIHATAELGRRTPRSLSEILMEQKEA